MERLSLYVLSANAMFVFWAKELCIIWEMSFHPSLLYFSRVFVLILKFLLWQIVHNPDETYGVCLCTRNLILKCRRSECICFPIFFIERI